MAVVLVTGGLWWSGDGDPAGRQPVAGADAKSDAGASDEAPPARAAAAPRDAAVGVPRASVAQPPKSRADASGSTPGAHGAGAPASRDGAVKRTRPRAAPKPAALPAPLSRSRPTAVAVPAITVEAPTMDLALDGQGRLGVPPVDDPERVGWYARGPAPGERGTAVMVGHRDTRTGPAVFLDLDSLGPGNTVRVARADGRVAVFTVDKVRTYAKSAFPDKEVYGSTGRPELRLLTCGGSFDQGSGYDANIVVFAHLTGIDTTI
ncbi:class F sortase [Streptomyces omiyaensis]|uniref:Class F sortase n=1 Tax=Streptomyces omiyaensis TaxID=68247 RepID=A0ABW7BUV2_9ACTN